MGEGWVRIRDLAGDCCCSTKLLFGYGLILLADPTGRVLRYCLGGVLLRVGRLRTGRFILLTLLIVPNLDYKRGTMKEFKM